MEEETEYIINQQKPYVEYGSQHYLTVASDRRTNRSSINNNNNSSSGK